MNLTSYENIKWTGLALATAYLCANFPQKQDTSDQLFNY
jgi:hypothetical protein